MSFFGEKITIDRLSARFGGKKAKIARKWRKIAGIPSKYGNLTDVAKSVGFIAKSVKIYEFWPEIRGKST